MNTRPYLKGDDIYELLMYMGASWNLGNFAEATKKHAKTEQEKRWAKWTKTAVTFLEKVIDEKLMTMDEKQLANMVRRRSTVNIKVVPMDSIRVQKIMDHASDVLVKRDQLLSVMELALMGCHCCPQGEYVKNCPYRQAMHACGVPISVNESDGPGRCEFRSEEGIYLMLPRGNDKQVELLREKLKGVLRFEEGHPEKMPWEGRSWI